MSRPGPRERLLEAASDLTYEQGVHVGVDAILKRADVARRSLYQHFGGKDELIAETLRQADVYDRYRRAMDEAGGRPRDRILAVFDRLEEITTAPSFRGCRYTAAELSLTDPEHPAHAEVRAYKDRLHRLFADELQRHGHPTPDAGADQILVLIDGLLAHALTRPDAHPALAARDLAEFVLDQKAG
ncbi:TetR/AcrR family transcriptional regulator [Actinomadura hibisca]|uniref:TetR/AcrR family transcriptional regulator n=1 Tax=Actinomadura hibisca TaxID=68565 RepID=UPI000830269C|nr:TetR/AcrR family transcriptional regulator [Actinomadura hibisca]